jgi:hypothetical protein
MKLLVAAVCEHAWVENGCLSMCRAFDTVNAEKFPYTLSRLSIALRILIRRSETGEHKVNLCLADPDGKKLMNTEFNVNMQLPESSLTESSFSFALNGQNIIFPKQGDYVVDVLVDSRVEASIPVYVKQSKPELTL